MKIVRRLLFVLAGLVVVAGLAVAAALTPAVQRWVALRALRGHPGWQVDIGRLAVRPGSVTVHGLVVTGPAGKVTLADGAAGLSLWDALVRHRLTLSKASATGLIIDLTAAARPPPVPAKAPTGSAPSVTGSGARPAHQSFDGVFGHLVLPVPVTLDHGHVAAEVVCPLPDGRPPARIQLTVDGGRLAPGQEAKFDFDARTENADPAAPMNTVAAHGAMTVALDDRGALVRIDAQVEAEARGANFSTPARLQVSLALEHTARGERYAVLVDSAAGAGPRHLLDVKVDYAPGTAQLAGTWQLAANDRDFAPFALGLALPKFTAAGEGHFELNPVTRTARLAGRFDANGSRFEAFDPRMRDFDDLNVTANFDLEYDGESVRVADLRGQIGGHQPLLSVHSVQPFSMDLGTRRLLAADPQKDLVRVDLEGLPVAWLRPWLPPEYGVSGSELTGAVVLALRDRTLWLHTLTPLSVRGLAVTRRGHSLLPASDLAVEADLERAGGATRVKLERLTLQTAAGDRLEANGEFDRAPDGYSVRAGVEGRMPTLLAGYLPVGPVEIRGNAALSRAGDILRLDQAAFAVRTPDGKTIADLTTTTAGSYDLATGRAATAPAQAGEVLRLQLRAVPLAAFRRYFGRWDVGGELVDGAWSLAVKDGRLSVAAVAPWRLRALSLGLAGRRLLEKLDADFAPSVAWTPAGFAFSLAELRVRNSAGADLLTGQAEATLGPELAPPKLQGAATLELMVPALAGQPLVAGAAPAGQGRLSGDIKFSLDRDLLGEGRLTLNGLVSPATGEPLPVANLSFRAGVNERGDVALQVPLLIDRAGERSDLTLAATLHPAPGGRTLDAKITGAHLVVDDLRALARPFIGAAKPETADAATGGRPAATGPLWAGLTGQVTLDLKSLAYSRNLEVANLTGRVLVEPDRMAFDRFDGRVGTDGRLKIDAAVWYDAARTDPYASKLDFGLLNFEIGPLFKTAAPDQPPTVDGRFDIRCHAEGTAATLGGLVERTRGDVTMQSRKGIFRGLQQPTAVSRAAGIIGSAARLLGNLSEKVESLTSRANMTTELGGMLAQLPYDQLNLRLSPPDASRVVKLSSFSLVSPNLRLQGEGQIGDDAGKGLLDRPLQLRVNMGVMGSTENLMTKAKSSLLAGERDELGYMKLKEPFVVGGTLAKPDAGQFYTMLGRSLLDIILLR